MKIALITIWREKNFGAEMQCYATVKALKQLGHDVEVIDFRLSDNSNLTFKQKIIKLLIKYSPEVKSFTKFWKTFIPYGHHYKYMEELRNNPPIADLYLVGSDQVWNLNITKNRWSTYFLDFVSKDKRCYSYASSFGEEIWEWPKETEAAGCFLRHFNRISVREVTGQSILSEIFKINSSLVLDPTLLHDNYNEIIKPNKDSNNLVYYPLSENVHIELFAKELATELGLGFTNTNKRNCILKRIVWRRTTIEEWIKNISEADFVVTSSFHGLAFCLIYQKQFIIIQNPKGKNRSSRITGLLKLLSLESRFFESVKAARNSKIWSQPIDYTEITPRLESLKSASWQYLKEITES